MEPAEVFLDELIKLIIKIKESQMGSIDRAAEIMSDAVVGGKLIYLWGPGGHSSIFAEDVMYRKGELAAVNPILDPGISLSHGAVREINGMERVVGYGKAVIEYNMIGKDDVIVIGSAYGINPVCIEAALECKKRGAFVISITSAQFSDGSQYAGAKHKSNKSLYEVSDLHIDSFVPYGDAVLKIDGLDKKIGPVATIMQLLTLKALMVTTIEKIKQKGIEPPIWTNSLQEGGIEENQEYISKIWGRVKSM